MNIRQQNWKMASESAFDVILLGAGINGAALYRTLCKRGYRVLLVDKGDFGCGTSQASAMMIWGGLLYLKNLEFRAVHELSRDRDEVIRSFGQAVRPALFRYLPEHHGGRNKHFVHAVLHLYWMLGGFRRKRPAFEAQFPEQDFLLRKATESLVYEEGFLGASDCRFVLDWVLDHQTEESFALNYCNVADWGYSENGSRWFLDLEDTIQGSRARVSSRCILNCTGVWADSVNRRFGIESP